MPLFLCPGRSALSSDLTLTLGTMSARKRDCLHWGTGVTCQSYGLSNACTSTVALTVACVCAKQAHEVLSHSQFSMARDFVIISQPASNCWNCYLLAWGNLSAQTKDFRVVHHRSTRQVKLPVKLYECLFEFCKRIFS